MEKQQHQQRRAHSSDEDSPSDVALALARGAAAVHPMGSVSAWVRDFTAFGASAGLVGGAMIATQEPTAADPGLWWWLLVLFALLMALQGVLAGFTTGWLLRALRGRVPAALGLALTVVGALLVTSVLPYLGGGVSLSVTSVLRGLPMTLSVAGLIPLTAVLRSRGKPTLLWMVLVGFVAGGLIVPARDLVQWLM